MVKKQISDKKNFSDSTIDNIKNEDIIYFGERIEPYFASSIIIRGMLDRKNLSEALEWNKGVRWIYTNDYFFMLKNDLAEAQNVLRKKFKDKGKDYVSGLINNCMDYGNNLIKISKNIAKETNDQNLDRKKMRDLLERYSFASSRYMVFQNIALFEDPVAELTQNVVKRYSKDSKEADRLLSLITVPSRETEGEKEHDDFLKLCIKRDNDLCGKHAKKYGWLSIRFFVGRPWKKEDVIRRLESVDAAEAKEELIKRKDHKKEIEKDIKNAIKGFTKEDKEYVGIIRDIVYLRTQRTDFFQESSYYVQPLLDKIAEELKISYSDLLYLSAKEVILSLDGKFDYVGCIKRRKEGFLVLFDHDKDMVLEAGKVSEYIRKRPVLDRSAKDVKEFSGNIGYKGHAVGKAKIVKTDKDNAKVMKGDILISIMTTPNLTPSMERAAAIVTDEGGITSHAAIFAREMKKPCVIGTKIATKSIKDGDLVEVDADKGLVKILKKS